MTKKTFSQRIFSKTRFSPIRTWEEYIDNNNKKIIFIFISWLCSCFHLKQSTKTKAITKVVVCVRWKDFLLLWRHHLQLWSSQLSLQHQNLWLQNHFVSSDGCTCLQSTWREEVSRDTFTRPGVIPFDNCLLTQSTYQVLNLFEMNLFAAWFTLISTGWNLLIRLWATITISQSFFVLSRFISALSWPL